ncbi:MAG: hypothetical protein Fur0042_11910 [Cyanophyceae cyanobacterium]
MRASVQRVPRGEGAGDRGEVRSGVERGTIGQSWGERETVEGSGQRWAEFCPGIAQELPRILWQAVPTQAVIVALKF